MSQEIDATQQQGAPETAPRKTFVPRVDVRENAQGIILTADLPGVDEKGLEVSLEGRVLTLEGRNAETAPADRQRTYAEYIPGDYRRRFTLALDRVDAGNIKARLRDGVLTVTIPKATAAQRRKIDIKAE
jgi:HSP20 family molecular chaperone IbpA